MNRFRINTNLSKEGYIIDKSFLSETQLQKLNGTFYPREVYPSASNPHIFYVKLPTSIATIFFNNGKL